MRNMLRCAVAGALLTIGVVCAPTAWADTNIDIDATVFGGHTIQVLNNGVWQSDVVETLSLVEDRVYTLVLSNAGTAMFEVTAAGLLDYDISLDDVFSGRGTTTLVVQGVLLQVDASALDRDVVNHLALGNIPNVGIATFIVLPGSHRIEGADITLDADGTVDYPVTSELYLGGRGTDTLETLGFDMTFDATTLDVDVMQIVGIAGNVFQADTVTTLRMMPGTSGNMLNLVPFHQFEISEIGTFDWPAAHDTFKAGRGTSTMTITGFDITIDVRGIAPEQVQIIGVSGGFLPTEATATFNLPPNGATRLLGADSQTFGVDLDGLIFDAPATYNGHVVTGGGASTLTVGSIDTEAPVVEASVTPGVIWPPNHQMIEVELSTIVTDDTDANPAVFVYITSNQPDDARGGGDGHTHGDIRVTLTDGTVLKTSQCFRAVEANVADIAKIEVRAERSGSRRYRRRGHHHDGHGHHQHRRHDRLYRFSVVAEDADGNVSEATDAFVRVTRSNPN